MGPKPPALLRAQRRRTRPMRSKKGAEMPCRKRMVSMPRRMTKTLRSQKSTKQPAGPEWDLGPARSEGHDHGVDGFAANPGLNAKPAASDQSSENRGNIRAECTERSAGKNGKRDAVL